MPSYKVEIPGFDALQIDSPMELSDEQIQQMAMRELSGDIGQARPQAIAGPLARPQAEAERFPGFAERVGRRVWEAVGAAKDIPFSAARVVTGGKGPGSEAEEAFVNYPRIAATLRLLQGVASPISALLSPVGAATEEAAAGLGATQPWSQLIGDVGEAVSTLGLGALGAAGKLGPGMQQFAKVVGAGRGAGGAAEQLQEALKHDPQLRFTLGRTTELAPEGRALEQLARTEAPLEELAMAVKSLQLAQLSLSNKQSAGRKWVEWAKQNQIISEAPPEARFSPQELLEFQPPEKPMTLLGTLGTPTNVAPRLHPKGGAVAYETALTEINMNKAVEARTLRVQKALMGVGDEDLRAGVVARESGKTMAELMAMPDEKLRPAVKRVVNVIQDKFALDREIAIPRLRKFWEDKFEPAVRKSMEKTAKIWDEPLDEAAIKAKVAEKVKQRIPDDWGLDNYLSHIWPGEWRILDKKNQLVGSASTRGEAEALIYSKVQSGEYAAADLHSASKIFVDSENLRLYKGRTSRTIDQMSKAAEISPEEIQAIAKGDFTTKSKFPFFGQFKQRSGKAKGYSTDLMNIFQMYDRNFEKWMQLSDLREKVAPILKELRAKGQRLLPWMLEDGINKLWGYRMPLSIFMDETIAATPILRDIVAPFALERLSRGLRNGVVNTFIKYSPKFHGVNATQVFTTLEDIADGSDIWQGRQLRNSDIGKGILQQHGITGAGVSRVEQFAKGLGPGERWNQEVAFLTMYNKARKLGLSDQQAGIYGKLRGNLYSQFLGLITDQPIAFRKLDPLGLATMFQRFPVKQYEQLLDLVKDRNFPGVAKWMAANLLLGGFKAATMGQGGWLTYKLYKDIEETYGKTTADIFHVGLPALAGVDVSGSVMLFNPPFGENWQERVGNMLAGPIGSTASSMWGAAINQAGVEPEAAKRAYNAMIQGVPLGKELDAFGRLLSGDYDFKDPLGRLRYKGELKDVVKRLMAAKPLKDADLDTYVSAVMDVTERYNSTLNYAASRYGQARLAGVDLGKEMQEVVAKEVDNWNALWPTMPITDLAIAERSKARSETAMRNLRERILKNAPAALRRGGAFGPTAEEAEIIPPGGG